jgi:Carboxypeptidase regulatory-like domain
MNKQLKSFIMTAGTALSLLAVTFTAAAASPKANANALAGAATQTRQTGPAAASTCTKMQATDVYWVTLDADGNKDQTVDVYPTESVTVTAAFDYNCIPKKTKLGIVWSINDEQVLTSNETPKVSDKADTYIYSLFTKDGSPLSNGVYGVEFYLGDNILTSGSITVGEDISQTGVTTETQTTDVAVQGTVVDSKSKKPISGAVVAVLNEGVDAAQWLKDGSDSDVLAYSKTDSKGQFELNERIPVGTALPWLIGAKGYKAILQQDFTIEDGAEDPYVLNIGLERSK